MKKFLIDHHSHLMLLSCGACLLDMLLNNTFSLVLVIILGPPGLIAMALDMYQNRHN